MNTILWNDILAFSLDEPQANYGFTLRLATENKWPIHVAEAAIVEYKRFMYLAATANAMVSPSEIVDVVWHQHLIFTKSYNDFCAVLGKNIAHIPNTHHSSTQGQFSAATERTRQLYEQAFGKQDAFYWNYRHVYDSLGLVPSQRKIPSVVSIGIWSFIVLAFLAYFLLYPLYIQIKSSDFLLGYTLLFIGVLVGLYVYNESQRQRFLKSVFQNPLLHQLSGAELVFLKNNSLKELINCALNQLIKEGIIAVSLKRKLSLTQTVRRENAFENALMEGFVGETEMSYPLCVDKALKQKVFAHIELTLNSLGKYIKGSQMVMNVFLRNYVVLLSVFLLGFTRLMTGILRDKPVLYLLILLVIILIVSIYFLWNVPQLFWGKSLLRLYNSEISTYEKEPDSTADWAWLYLATGRMIFTPSFVSVYNQDTYGSNNQNAYAGSSCGGGSSDGGGSSCGGSSCGSSCGGGGCGGCGGD